jgi:hypothetical protein
VPKTLPESFNGLRGGFAFDLDHGEITLRAAPLHRANLNPGVVLHADPVAESMETMALMDAVILTRAFGQKGNQLVRICGPRGGRVSIKTDHDSTPLRFAPRLMGFDLAGVGAAATFLIVFVSDLTPLLDKGVGFASGSVRAVAKAPRPAPFRPLR